MKKRRYRIVEMSESGEHCELVIQKDLEDYAKKSEVDRLRTAREEVKHAVNESLRGVVGAKLQSVIGEKLEQFRVTQNQKIDHVQEQVDEAHTKIDHVQEQMDEAHTKIDHVQEQMDEVRTEMRDKFAEVNGKLDQLLSMAKS